jgi:thiamine biosynthesis lipoprotein
MGCEVELIVIGGKRDLLGRARARIEDLEQKWSRFIGSSEVSRLNHAEGAPLQVSPDTRLLVRRALLGHRITGGAFDPTLLGAVLRAGYVTSFEHLGAGPADSTSAFRTGATRIELDEPAGIVRVPAGVGFDAGGVGKGLAADLVAEELAAADAIGVCVNVGGDLRVLGASPSGDSWHVGVEDPRSPRGHIARLHIRHGGVATSSRVRRQWRGSDGTPRHHLIDPRTGASSRSVALTATVAASEAWRAEVLTKAAFIDVRDGLALVESLGAAGMVVVPDGRLWTSSWPELCAPTEREGVR